MKPSRRAVAALRHRDFRTVWASAIASNTGSFMQAVTVPFVIYRITGSSLWLGICAAAALVPQVLVGPLAGVVADTLPRKHVVLTMQVVQMLAAFVLWGLWAGGMARPGLLLAVVVVASFAAGVNLTCWQAFVPSLVPREDLLGALRLNTIQFSLSAALGPALAGAILSVFGPGFTFFGNAVSFLLVIAALVSVGGGARAVAPTERPPLARQLADGVRYIRARRRRCTA